MIYTVTFNPSLDYVVTVDEFQTGKVNRTTNEIIFPGGKGINVSMMLSNLCVESTALGFVAGFTGAELQARLQEKGILTDFVQVSDGMTRINVKLRVAITEEEDCAAEESVIEEETEINGQGPVITEDELAQLMEKINALKEEDVLIISGSVPKGIPQSTYADIVKVCNEKNMKVIVDASSALLWNTLEYGPFLIKPNHHELGDIFSRDIRSYDEVVFYAKELQNQGAKNVLVSLGAKGAILIAEDGKVYESEAPKGDVINSVGAGDSMVAGFMAEFLRSGDYEKALQMGVCAGSASSFSENLATREEVMILLEQIHLEKL